MRAARTPDAKWTMPRLDSPHVVNIEDLRRLARRRLPRAVFDYMDGGAADEVTLRDHCRALQKVVLRPRHAVANQECDLRTRVVGHDISFPAILAPVGYSRLMHPGGEVAAARGREKAERDSFSRRSRFRISRTACETNREKPATGRPNKRSTAPAVLSVSPLRFGSRPWLREPTLNSPKGQRNEFRKLQENYKSSHRATYYGAERGSKRDVDAISRRDWPIPSLQ
jgi:hypothetical protein